MIEYVNTYFYSEIDYNLINIFRIKSDSIELSELRKGLEKKFITIVRKIFQYLRICIKGQSQISVSFRKLYSCVLFFFI